MKALLLLITFIFSFFVVACKDDEFSIKDIPYNPQQCVCGINDVANNLDWLKVKIQHDNTVKNPIWKIYVYNDSGKDLILINHFSSSLAVIDEIYDCRGNLLDQNNIDRIAQDIDNWVCVYDSIK